MSISKKQFGKIKGGQVAHLYTLKNKNGMQIDVTDFGANIVRILVPDKKEFLRMLSLDMTIQHSMKLTRQVMVLLLEDMQTVSVPQDLS